MSASTMAAGSELLKSLLLVHLASDSSAVSNLPFALTFLCAESFTPSPHLPKWTARLNSLIHSKDSGARWAGLVLAQRTSGLSKAVMMECAQGWVTDGLTIISRPETIPVLKGAIRLLATIFTTATEVSEFQRRIVTPNIPKFANLLNGLAERDSEDLIILVLHVLSQIVVLYPTLCRPIHQGLSTLALKSLNGNAPQPVREERLKAASRLYVALHRTGGKIGAANLWRKSLEETLEFGWNALSALRTTFNTAAKQASSHFNSPDVDVPLNIDRLRCCAAVICELLSSSSLRAVSVPVGSLVKFITAMLTCERNEKEDEHIDPVARSLEDAVTSKIWIFGCELLACLANRARHHLSPHLCRLISYLTLRLEQQLSSTECSSFLAVLQVLLYSCQPFDSSITISRVTRVLLSSISRLMPTASDVVDVVPAMKTKKGKKRARSYDGEEIFNVSRQTICPQIEDGEVMMNSVQVLRILLRNPNISSSTHSISARVLLSTLLALIHMPPTLLSPDEQLHKTLLRLVYETCVELGSGTTNVMSKTLGLVIRLSSAHLSDGDQTYHDLDILLHPRVPPLIRSLPHVESLSFFHAEQSQEETDIIRDLHVRTLNTTTIEAPMEKEVAVADDQPSLPNLQHTVSKVVRPTNDRAAVMPPDTSTVSRVETLLPQIQPLASSSNADAGSAQNKYASVISQSTSQSSMADSSSATSKRITQEVPRTTSEPVEDEDEEMPSINLESDSDSD